MGWTAWRKIAEANEWFPESFGDWAGAAVYELAIAGPRGGALQIVYVGETVEEPRRVRAYAQNGSHLADVIALHLALGWSLFYRAQACRSKGHAKRRQDSLLANFEYGWNIVGQ